jgi:hypothetical protein
MDERVAVAAACGDTGKLRAGRVQETTRTITNRLIPTETLLMPLSLAKNLN